MCLFNFAAGEIMQHAVQSPLCVNIGMFNHSHWQRHNCLLPGYSDDRISTNMGVAVLWHTGGHLTECCSPRAASACQSSGTLRGSAQSIVRTVGDLNSVGQLAEGRNCDRVHCRYFTRAEEGENFRWGLRDFCSLSRPWIGAQFNYNAPHTWARCTVAANCKLTQSTDRIWTLRGERTEILEGTFLQIMATN